MSPDPVSTTSPRLLSQRLFGNSLWNLGAYTAYIILTIVSAPLYIRFLGLQNYGLLVLLNSILIPLGLLSQGFAQATIKYIAESSAQGNVDEAGEYLSTTLLFNIGVGVLGALVIVLSARFLSTVAFEINAADQQMAQAALGWIALSWLVTQVTATLIGVPVALQKYRLVSIGATGTNSINIMIGLLVLWSGGDLLALIRARFIWILVTVGMWTWVVQRLLPGVCLWPRFHRSAFRRSFNFSVWQTVAAIGGLLGGQTDKYLLGIYISTAAVGLYNIPYLIFQTGYAVVSKLGEVLFPAVSDLQGRGENEQLQHVVLRSSWMLSILMAAIMGALFVFAHDLLRLYIGIEVADSSAHVLQLLALAAILSAPSVGILQYLLGTGNTVWTAVTAIASGLITLAGGLILIPRFDLQGAAWSNLIAIMLSRPLIHLLIWRSHLRGFVRWQGFLTHLYGPALAAVPVVCLMGWLRSLIDWLPRWAGLTFGTIVSLLLTSVAIVALDSFLPGHVNRRADLFAVLGQFVGTSRRVVHWVRMQIRIGL